MNRDRILIDVFIEREHLKEQIEEIKRELNNLKCRYYAIGAPLNDNVLRFNKKQRAYLYGNVDIVKYLLAMLGGDYE